MLKDYRKRFGRCHDWVAVSLVAVELVTTYTEWELQGPHLVRPTHRASGGGSARGSVNLITCIVAAWSEAESYTSQPCERLGDKEGGILVCTFIMDRPHQGCVRTNWNLPAHICHSGQRRKALWSRLTMASDNMSYSRTFSSFLSFSLVKE